MLKLMDYVPAPPTSGILSVVLRYSFRRVLRCKIISSLDNYSMLLFQVAVSLLVSIVTFVSYQNRENGLSSWHRPWFPPPFFNGIWNIGWISLPPKPDTVFKSGVLIGGLQKSPLRARGTWLLMCKGQENRKLQIDEFDDRYFCPWSTSWVPCYYTHLW